MHLALADAFGSSIDPNKTKNRDMRNFITNCRKTIETVNKSKVLKARFKEKVLEEFKKTMKLRNSPTHRWAATEDVFIGLLQCWNVLGHAFVESNQIFKLQHDRKLLLELRSIIHPIHHIQ